MVTTGINSGASFPTITTVGTDRWGLLDEANDVLDLFDRAGETYRYVRHGDVPPDERREAPVSQQPQRAGGGMGLTQMLLLAGGLGTGLYFITQAGAEGEDE